MDRRCSLETIAIGNEKRGLTRIEHKKPLSRYLVSKIYFRNLFHEEQNYFVGLVFSLTQTSMNTLCDTDTSFVGTIYCGPLRLTTSFTGKINAIGHC